MQDALNQHMHGRCILGHTAELWTVLSHQPPPKPKQDSSSAAVQESQTPHQCQLCSHSQTPGVLAAFCATPKPACSCCVHVQPAGTRAAIGKDHRHPTGCSNPLPVSCSMLMRHHTSMHHAIACAHAPSRQEPDRNHSGNSNAHQLVFKPEPLCYKPAQ